MIGRVSPASICGENAGHVCSADTQSVANARPTKAGP